MFAHFLKCTVTNKSLGTIGVEYKEGFHGTIDQTASNCQILGYPKYFIRNF